MKSISKEEKAYILAHCPKAIVKKTTNHYFIEELPEVLRLLEDYKKLNIKEE